MLIMDCFLPFSNLSIIKQIRASKCSGLYINFPTTTKSDLLSLFDMLIHSVFWHLSPFHEAKNTIKVSKDCQTEVLFCHLHSDSWDTCSIQWNILILMFISCICLCYVNETLFWRVGSENFKCDQNTHTTHNKLFMKL